MAEFELGGHTLGQKHQHYNTLFQDAIKNNKTLSVGDFNLEGSEVINLLNIDIASYNKNVDYILKVLACDDMLFVSRAIKQSDWIINDQDYIHIINPEYLQTNLFPQMCKKAIIKFKKHIRNILKDHKRAEQFYYCEEKPEEAVKWLPCCSEEFIIKNVKTHVPHIKATLLRRLCEKTKTVLEIYVANVAPYETSKALQACMFLLPSNADWFLDIVEANKFPNFNKSGTCILMKECASRVTNKFDKYYNFIHLPTFIKCLKQENIKQFLFNQAQEMSEHHFYRYFNLKRLLFFVRLMPQEIRFQFVNDVFINKTHESKANSALSEKEIKAMNMFCKIPWYPSYNKNIWYQFAPFNIALQKIQELISTVSSIEEKVSFLEIVLISAQKNLSHERTFLEYIRDNLKNTESNVKEQIIIKLIMNFNYIHYDKKTWNVLNDIFKHIDVYNQTKTSENVILEAIILYNVIHKEKVPEIVENKFQFNTLVRYHNKLTNKEREIIFIYLYDLVVENLTVKCKTTNEKKFKEKLNMLELTLNLLKDYKKDLKSYPTIIDIIKDLIQVKVKQSWTVNLEKLFNIKKTWRKLLFEESLVLCQTNSVLFNALKHDPSLLERNEIIVKNMLCNDKLPLKQVLRKIKIYWSSSLAKPITITYMENIKCPGNHKVTTTGLSILLPLKKLQELIEKFTPMESKVDWAKIDEVELSVQQQFAKNMHNSNPQPNPEIILRFAKGDYLQYALPSLQSIFYNLNDLASQKYIPYMLDAPVSLQKHGIRLAVSKLNYENLLCHLNNIWKSNKNASIRSVMFKTVYELLCKEKDSNKIKTTWELMEMLIDNITFQEDKAIYKLLSEVSKVPLEVRGLFYMKSYNILHQLTNSGEEYKDYKHQFYTTFTGYSREIIEQLEPAFVTGIISEFVTKEFTKREIEVWSYGCVIPVISSYLLSAADEQTQLERYEKVLLSILKQSFSLWKAKDFVRNNLRKLLNQFRCDIKQYVIDMKKVNPYKMFQLIQNELNDAIESQANYVLLTKWKLTVTFVSILETHHPIFDWEQTCIKVANEFGNKCISYLKEDCNKYFPRIYLLFVKALISMLSDFIPETAYWDIYRSLMQDNTFIQGYLAAIVLMSNISLSTRDQEIDEKKKNFQELCKNIREHPSTEIKIHYYNQIEEIK